MAAPKQQTGLFVGIYEFEDPSGTLLAARVPASGAVDIYNGTTLVVRPNQCAILVHKGQIADILTQGTHTLKTENMPLLTRLAHWRKGVQNAVRAELWFFSGMVFTARRWGTALNAGPLSLRAYGNYHIFIRDPRLLFKKMVGTQQFLDITEVEKFVQGQLLAAFPSVVTVLQDATDLAARHQELAAALEALLVERLAEFGLSVSNVNVVALVPPSEAVEATGYQPMENSPAAHQRCISCHNVTDTPSGSCPHCGRALAK